jgi:hypothetical protein
MSEGGLRPPSDLTVQERARLQPDIDVSALNALAQRLPPPLRAFVVHWFACDAGAAPWRHEHNALVAAAGLPASWQIPESGDWALGITWGDPTLDALWKAVPQRVG